jgi:hypothetical protein
VLKSFDDNDPQANVRMIASKNLLDDLPPDVAKTVSRIIGLAMTYDGYLALPLPARHSSSTATLVLHHMWASGTKRSTTPSALTTKAASTL